MRIDPAWFSGPYGGLLAVAFMAGVAFGYGFAVSTVLKLANKRIDELKRELDDERRDCNRRMDGMRTRIEHLEAILMAGHHPQLAQIRESSERVLNKDNGVKK